MPSVATSAEVMRLMRCIRDVVPSTPNLGALLEDVVVAHALKVLDELPTNDGSRTYLAQAIEEVKANPATRRRYSPMVRPKAKAERPSTAEKPADLQM